MIGFKVFVYRCPNSFIFVLAGTSGATNFKGKCHDPSQNKAPSWVIRKCKRKSPEAPEKSSCYHFKQVKNCIQRSQETCFSPWKFQAAGLNNLIMYYRRRTTKKNYPKGSHFSNFSASYLPWPSQFPLIAPYFCVCLPLSLFKSY